MVRIHPTRLASVATAAAISFAVAAVLAPPPALACRYTVRDIGFIDVGVRRHVVSLCVHGDGGPLAAAFREAAESAFRDAPVRLEVVDVDRDRDHPAAARVLSSGAPIPALVLGTPEGRLVDLPAPPASVATAAEASSALEAALRSPVRDAIAAEALGAHSFLLVFEGTDAAANRTASAIADRAIEEVELVLEDFPDPVPGPARKIVISPADRGKEKVLVASLGIEEAPGTEARIAILHGRLRRLGPIFAVPGAEREDVLEVLAMAGLDCECGLDRRWMTGPTVPHRWGPKEREDASRRLGYDPESPMVKAEVASILSRGPGSRFLGLAGEGGAGRAGAVDPLLGYSELEIDDEAPRPEGANAAPLPPLPPPAPAPGLAPAPGPAAGAPARPEAAGRSSPLRPVLVVLAALGAVGLAAGAVILARARRSP